MKKKKSVISAGGIVFKKEVDKTLWLIVKHVGANHWGFPKGHVADKIKDEKLEEAALREVLEEGGIQATIIRDKPYESTYYFTSGDTTFKKTVHYFLMRFVSGDTKNHDHEVSDAKFASEDEVLETLTFKGDKEIFGMVKK